MTPKKWVESTNAIGIISKSGRYGGTFAHKDLAFEFGATDAIRDHIIPSKNYNKDTEWLVYAEEADLLNVALFNCTAKDWRETNKDHSDEGLNIRDFASINELVVLSNLENINALLIEQKIAKEERFKQLNIIAKTQLSALDGKDFMKSIKRLSEKTYLEKKEDINEE